MTQQVQVDPRGLTAGRLTPPVSKSDAQRALVLAFLTGVEELPTLAEEPESLWPADLRTLRKALQLLRAPETRPQAIDCADGGAPFRFFLTQAAVRPHSHVLLSGTPRLGERPHQPLFASLRAALGPAGLVLKEGSPWPLEVQSGQGTVTPLFRISASESSQYASSLLLGAAALMLQEKRPWSVQLEGALTSPGYLDLTLEWLARFGFQVEHQGATFRIAKHQMPQDIPSVPGDWSSLGYLLLVGWRSHSVVERVDLASAHPDQALLRIVEAAGLKASQVGSGRHQLRLTGTGVSGIDASGKECPDLLPTLAALACVLPAPSVLRDVGILRHKESDRLAGIQELVSQFGGVSQLEGDTLHLQGPQQKPDFFRMDSHEDHRLAMSAATLSVLSGCPLLLTGPDCVSKSFPGFWQQLEKVGVRLG